ncbi:MAG TPA: DUF447 domain-containing protein, partial [Pirellulales bacterium]
TSIDDSRSRTEITAQVVEGGRIRDFFGFNRAMHAVVEADILATRIGLIANHEITAEFNRLAPLVEKTGGEREREAFRFLQDYVDRSTHR